MDFRTEIKIPVSSFPISHSSTLLFIGSCFSYNIGTLLKEDKFDTLINPFGTIYNPHSIAHLLSKSITEPIEIESGIVKNMGRFVHLDYHSDLSSMDKKDLLNKINEQLQLTSTYIKKATHIFVTLGSAYVFEDIETDRIVANCHKLPASRFRRRLLNYEEIRTILNNLILKIHEVNKNVTILFTVSPIRHIRDGLASNSRSKAILISCSHDMTEQYKGVEYFPSYEILMDDLRDYRYYKEDMTHPSDVAIKYIYKKFEQSYFLPETQKNCQNVRKILNAVNHIPINPLSDEHQLFVENTLMQIEEMEETKPFKAFDFTYEKRKLVESSLPQLYNP